MTAPTWYFKSKQPDDTIREPIQGEFFATEAIRDSAEALVREAIQNSLDARLPGQRVRVRFYVSGSKGAVSAKSLSTFTAGLIPHLAAEGNGLRNNPTATEGCRFLVVEDFGTSGLRGNVSQWKHIAGVRNDFYSFFRAEGQSDKSDSARGRWGIGKFVFPRVSRASCFFALTVREEVPKNILMGRAILRSHDINNITFVPDGYFGGRPEALVLPIDADATLKTFTRLFNISRTDETGLSVVVPWYDDSVSVESILTSVLRDYYYAIMSGQLDVSVEDSSVSHFVSATTINEVVAARREEFELEMRPFLALAAWSLETKESDLVRLQSPAAQGGPAWDLSMIPQALAKPLRASLQKGEGVALRVPISVKPKHSKPEHSYFDVFLNRTGEETAGRITFIREGIIVTAAGGRKPPGYNALVVINEGPLANLLGDAENPAHTEWRRDTRDLQEKYSYASSYLTFVKQSVATIARYLSEGDVEPDNDLLMDVFFTTTTEDDGPHFTPKPKPKQKGKEPDSDEILGIQSSPRRFQVSQTTDGFAITQGSADVKLPFSLRISVAYDIRRGSALKHYDEADFNLEKRPVTINTPLGAEITATGSNTLSALVTAIPFRIGVTGFDPHRDLFIRVASEASDDGD